MLKLTVYILQNKWSFNISVAEQDRPSLSRQSSSGQSSSLPLQSEFSTINIPAVKMEDRERPGNALQILKLVCDSPALKSHLRDLLTAKYVDS